MNIDWQALLDWQIAVVCRSPEKCEAFCAKPPNRISP